MSYKFNPFTGNFDLTDSGSQTNEKKFTAVDEILVKEESELIIESNSEVLIVDKDLECVQTIINSVTVLNNGELVIQDNSAVEIIDE